MSSRRLIGVAVVFVAWLAMTTSAHAATIAIDFESGASVGDQITNQYATPSGIPEGPTFMTPGAAGFQNWTSAECGPGHLTNSYAHSGSNSVKLDGCSGGEFWPTSTLFAMGYTTNSVSFYIAVDGQIFNGSHDTIVSTAFDANHNVVQQVTTTLGAQTGPSFQLVQLSSTTDNIAYVAVEHGSVTGNTSSPTGVTEGVANVFLYLDDLTYNPPASPPSSSFTVGANPSASATVQGGSVHIDIPINWINNPNPSADPVTLAAATPTGVTASFSPNPSSTGDSKLTLNVAKNAPTGQTSVTVTGTVGSKTSHITIPFGISSPMEVTDPGKLTLAPCTPRQVALSVQTASTITQPVTISVAIPSATDLRILGISGSSGAGTVTDPHDASVTVTPSGGKATATLDLAVLSGAPPSGPTSFQVSAQTSGYATQTNDNGAIAIETGEIDHVYQGASTFTPLSVRTAWLGQAATPLTLIGAGFCPGSMVALGNLNDLVAPTSLSSDGTSLTFSVPRGATTGKIVVIPSENASITGPSLTVRTFRNTWGFSFMNGDFNTLLSQDMEDELFGKDETNINAFGWLVRKPEAYEYQTMTNNHVHGGLCFGFAYSSLEFFDHPQDMSIFPTSGGNDSWHIDVTDPTAKQNLINFLVERFSLQFTDQLIPYEVNAVLGIHGTNDDLNAIQSGLASGEPVMIGMIHWSGASITGHTVLAYDTQPLPDGSTAVDVVNSNEPYLTGEETNPGAHDSREFTNSQIIINNGNWTFPEGAEFQGSNGQPWSGSEADLVVYPHDALPIINGQRPKLPNVFTGTIMVAFGSSGDGITQLTGGGGALFKNGQLAPQGSWPTGAAPLPSFTSGNGPLELVAMKPGSKGTLTATVSRHSGGGAMTMNLPGVQATLNAGVKAGQLDHVSVSPGADQIGYSAGAANTPFGGTLLTSPQASISAAGSDALSDRMVQFKTTVGSGGDTVALPPGGELTMTHHGPAAPLTLTLSSFSAQGEPVAVTLPGMRLASGEKLQVKPLNWRALGSALIDVTTTVNGRARSRLVRGRRLGASFAIVRGAKLHPIRHGRYRVDVSLHVRRAPAGGWVSIAATVLRRGRAVASAAPAQLVGVTLKSQIARLSLPGSLAKGRYTLLVRLLETTPHGPVAGSVVVSQRVGVRVG